MTAYPTTCLVDHEDGYRTVITLEEASDSYVEQNAMGVLVVSGDSTGAAELRVGLSPEALEAFERRCRELRGVPEGEPLEPGTVVARVWCPCCGVRIEVQASDDVWQVPVSQGDSPVIRDLTESRAQVEERAKRLENLVEEWKAASGLDRSEDPDGVTPQAAQRYWSEVEHQREQLRDKLSAVATVRDSLKEQLDRAEKLLADLTSTRNAKDLSAEIDRLVEDAIGMDQGNLAAHYACAVANWNGALDERDQLRARVAELESELAKRTAPSTGRPYPLE